MCFNYHDIKFSRVAYVHNFGEALAEEERGPAWLAEEPEEELPEEITEEEIKKREEDKAKKAIEESEEVTTMAKRKGYKLYIHGDNFQKNDHLTVVFVYTSEEGETVTKQVKPIYKNPKLLGLNIPDMGEGVPIGNFPLSLEYTLNKQ